MSKRGRPIKLNPALKKRICALLAKGSTIESACILCGVGERTFHDWMKRGKNGEEPFASFFSAATRAREQHKARLISVVMEAAHKDARHAEWLLERQFPREFAPYDRRPIPVEPEKERGALIEFTVMHEGRKVPSTFAELQKTYANFPVVEAPVTEGPNQDDDEGYRYFNKYGVVRAPSNGDEDDGQ